MLRALLAALTLAALPALPAWAEIKIGLAGPFTGQYAAFGEQLRRGTEQAVADINQAGGVMGQKIVLEVADDACDPKQAVSAANQLVSKGVVAVIGHFCSGSSIPANDVYAEEGVLQISPATTNPKYTEQKRWNALRVCGRDDQQGAVAAHWIAEHLQGRKVAIVHDKQTYSQGLAESTTTNLKPLGVEPVLFDTVNPGEKDYSALVTRLKKAGVQVLYYGGYHTEAGLIVRQMREQGLDAILFGGDGLVSTEYWSITGPAGSGTLMTFSPDPAKDPANAGIVKRFTDAGYKPEGYTLYSYGALQAWAKGAEAAKSAEGKKVATALRAAPVDTVLGRIGFDAKGDVTAPGYVVYVWKDGGYDYAQ